MFSIKTILHPTDFSDRSEHALKVACALAADYAAHLVLLHVVRTPLTIGEGILLPAAVSGEDPSRHQVEEGHAATEVLRVAQACHADLIVLGTHGRRGTRHLLMGSIAEELIGRARCPVMTVATPLPNGNAAMVNHHDPAAASLRSSP